MATGVVETLRIVYEVAVADKGTKGLLASERAVQKSLAQTTKGLTKQDGGMRRAAQVAQQAARARTRAMSAEVTATRRATDANEKYARSAKRAAKAAATPSVVRRAGAVAGGRAKGAAGMVTGLVSIAAAKQAVSVTEELAKTTISLNKNLGIGVTQASRWAAVARSRNIDSKALNMSFVTLAKNIGKAGLEQEKYDAKLEALGKSEKDQEKRQKLIAKGAGLSVDAFKKLGISQKELGESDFDTVLKKAADGLAEMPAGAERAALSAKLFGRGWQTVVPILRGGSKAMDEQLKLADKYGVTFRGKTVDSVMELVVAQREAKFASMGLQLAFGTQVAPALTKVINKGSQFVRQMRDGTGAGGRFAKQAKSIATDLAPVGRALKSVGGFLAEHPRLVVAAAGAYVAFKAARGTMKIVGDIRSMSSAVRGVAKTARESRLAEALASSARGAGGLIKKALGGVKGVVRRLMGSAGASGGSALASNAASGAGSAVGGRMNAQGGRFRKAGAAAGKMAGKGFVTGILIAIPVLIWEFKDQINKLGRWFSETAIGKIVTAPGKVGGWLGRQIGKLTGTNRKRRGGIVRRYQQGGLVPILASGGEMLVDGGRASMIPGPSNRDATPMLARPGSVVLTGHGQSLMAGGASLSQAVAEQAPHFAKGGKVDAYRVRRGAQEGGFKRPDLLWGVYGAETNFGRNVSNSTAGARGPFQFMPATAAAYGIDPMNFRQAARAAAKYLRKYQTRGTPGMLAAYNAGPGAKPPYPRETRAYIPKVVDLAKTYPLKGSKADDSTTGTKDRQVAINAAANRRRAGLTDDPFGAGIEAGRAGLTRGRIRREGNPIMAAISEARTPTTRTIPGRTAESSGAGTPRMRKMIDFAARAGKRFPKYVYGGGHASFAGPYDCSGYASVIVHSGGFLSSPMSTDGFKNWGVAGNGKRVTVGVRGSTGRAAHMMVKIGSTYWESANSRGPTGRRSGWSGNFPIKRHPRGYRTGGMIGRRTVPLDKLPAFIARRIRKDPSALIPGSPSYVGEGLRAGGVVGGGRFPGLRLPGIGTAGGAAASPGAALTGALARAMTMIGGSLEALDTVIGRSVEGKLLALRDQITKRVRKGGSAKAIQRLQATLDLIDFELGRRVGRILDVVEQRTAKVERQRSVTDRTMRRRGIEPDSAQGIGVMATLQAQETKVGQQNVASLQSALRRAQNARNPAAVKDITQQLQDARDALDESLVRQLELRRDAVRAAAQEGVNTAQFNLAHGQGSAAGLEAQQRLNRTQDTPAGMVQRATFQQSVIVPALAAAAEAAKRQAWMLATIGDTAGWRQAMLDAQSATTDLANAQADAADMMREAAARVAQDRVDAATHGRTMSDLALQRLTLEQQLIGTHDSAGGAQGRADFIRSQILPAIQAEIAALIEQRTAATAAGDLTLAQQIAEAIYAKENEKMQQQLEAMQQTAENTSVLKDFGGSAAFSYRDQMQTDLDVIRSRVGA